MKFAVISGFLGAGKTTVMMALTKHNPAVAMISNDLGEGVELADHRFAKLSGCSASIVAGSASTVKGAKSSVPARPW